MSWDCPISLILAHNIWTKDTLFHVVCPCPWKKKGTSFDDFSWCVRMAEYRCSFFPTGGTTVHWHSEKASIQSLFLPHTLAERERSDLSLLYYPDAPAPLGMRYCSTSIMQCLHQQGIIQWGNSSHPVRATKCWSRGREGRLRTWCAPGGLGQTLHLSELGPWTSFQLHEQY